MRPINRPTGIEHLEKPTAAAATTTPLLQTQPGASIRGRPRIEAPRAAERCAVVLDLPTVDRPAPLAWIYSRALLQDFATAMTVLSRQAPPCAAHATPRHRTRVAPSFAEDRALTDRMASSDCHPGPAADVHDPLRHVHVADRRQAGGAPRPAVP